MATGISPNFPLLSLLRIDGDAIVVRRLSHFAVLALALGLGYVWGQANSGSLSQVNAQDSNAGPSDEAQRKIQAAYDALKVALEGLKAESLYTPATKGVNVYAVLTGGVDAIADLESGRGVDPETFAALYSDLATDEVLPHLGHDSEGRLTYKNKLVRIYPVSRLKRLHAQRQLLTGEVLRTSADRNQ